MLPDEVQAKTTATRFLQWQEHIIQDMREVGKLDYYLARLCYEIYLLRRSWGSDEDDRTPRDYLMFPDEGEEYVIRAEKKEKGPVVYQPPPPPPRDENGKVILTEEERKEMEKSKAFWGKVLGMDPVSGQSLEPTPGPNRPKRPKR